MTCRRKFLAVGAILAIGLVLAWPFRRTAVITEPALSVPLQPTETLRASNGDPIAAVPRVPHSSEIPLAPAPITVQPASTGADNQIPNFARNLTSFDIANHPALAGSASLPFAQPAPPPPDSTSEAAEPAYLTGPTSSSITPEEWPAEFVHVVANGDTLEKLAERYLNDAGRALEIFDLNRDQLSNPHLLPIGVELRVPRNPARIMD